MPNAQAARPSFSVSRRSVLADVKGVVGPFQRLSFDLMLSEWSADNARQQQLEARRILRQFGYEVGPLASIQVQAVQ